MRGCIDPGNRVHPESARRPRDGNLVVARAFGRPMRNEIGIGYIAQILFGAELETLPRDAYQVLRAIIAWTAIDMLFFWNEESTMDGLDPSMETVSMFSGTDSCDLFHPEASGTRDRSQVDRRHAVTDSKYCLLAAKYSPRVCQPHL
jgi:hypothetical protein